MKVHQDESLGEQSEDTCSTTFPTSPKRFFKTDGDDDERCSGTDRPFGSIHGCSNEDHDIPARYDGMNYHGDAQVTFGATTVHAPRTPCHQSSNAFAIEDAEEECIRALRGHFVRRYGTNAGLSDVTLRSRDQTRDYRKSKRPLTQRRSIISSRLPTHPLPVLHAVRLRDARCGTEHRRSQRPRYAGVQLTRPKSTAVQHHYSVPLARHARRSAFGSPRT
ncbi:hypothetical protein MRX96_014080 [Rhipicephalus microplus]